MSENLWPDFDIGQTTRSPKTVIEEAGRGLEKKTKGLVEFYRTNLSIRDNKVEALFSLYTPSLGYHFPFMRAQFAVDPVYPVTVVADKMTDVVANDEKELTAALAKIFNAPSTVDTIQRLMSLGQQ
jgi:hypothetical protein